MNAGTAARRPRRLLHRRWKLPLRFVLGSV
jgi:hypothetical protein